MGLIRDFVDFLDKNMPSKEDFINTFKTLGWSNKEDFYNDRKHKRQVQIALSTLELIKSNSNNYAEFTIEHILPDSLERNANIGNLLPLEANLNSNCKDKPLRLKMNSYRQSNFRLVREFVERYAKQTDRFDVSERCQHMAEAIYDKIFQLYTDFSKSRL